MDPNNATSSFPLPVSASTVALNQVTHPASTNSIDNKLTLQSSTPSSLMAPSTISGSASTTSGGAILHNSDVCLLPVKQEVSFLFTSGFYHIGILYPNDGKCHLDKDGYYTESKNQDYPSVSQINYIAQQVFIWIITVYSAQF